MENWFSLCFCGQPEGLKVIAEGVLFSICDLILSNAIRVARFLHFEKQV